MSTHECSVRSRRRRAAVVGLAGSLVTVWFIAFPPAVANADCTGSDFGADSGCPPPGDSSGSGKGKDWPPTAVDWPPSQKSDSGGGGDKATPATPIVMPNGQPAPPPKPSSSTSDSDTTSTPPTPIVPVGSVSAGPTTRAIVTPTASTP